jgi:hypothetical protein
MLATTFNKPKTMEVNKPAKEKEDGKRTTYQNVQNGLPMLGARDKLYACFLTKLMPLR